MVALTTHVPAPLCVNLEKATHKVGMGVQKV